jgi:hypothetical protein
LVRDTSRTCVLKSSYSANHNQRRTATHIIGEQMAGRQEAFEISDCASVRVALPMPPDGWLAAPAGAARYSRGESAAQLRRLRGLRA